jgi:multiple sugar transport system substrate-binding protein
MKKVVVFSLMVLCMLAVFVSGSKDAKGEPIVITFWTHEDPNRTTIETRYIEEFEVANPEIKIERVTYPSQRMAETILTAFAANQGPHIFNMEIENEYAYIANGRVAPVDVKAAGYGSFDDLRNAYVEKVLDPVTVDGKVYGLPLELTNWCVYVNKKLFRDAGLDPEKDYPKTWEQMVEVSEKIVIQQGDIITRRGFDFRYPYYLVSIVPMVEQLGGKLVSDDGKTAIIDDRAWLKFLQFMADWGPNGKNLGSPTYTNARKLFNADKNDIAMCLSGLYQEGRIRAENEAFYNSGEWMVIPFPQFKDAVKEMASCYYGHYYMVNTQKPATEQEAAWKFIAFMLSHSEEYLTEVGLIQPTKKLMASEIFKKIPYSDVFAGDMEKGHIVYYAENSAKMQELLQEAIESVMLSDVKPEEALSSLKVKAQEILDLE